MRLVFLLLLLCPVAYAQSTGAIGGLVIDDELGEPLPGANVVLGDTGLGAATDLDGRFLVTEIPIGKYEVTALFVGYDSKTVIVEVFSGRTYWLGFELDPKVPYDMSHGWPYTECDSGYRAWTPLVSRDPFAPRVLSGDAIACLPIER